MAVPRQFHPTRVNPTPFDPTRVLGCSPDEARALFHGRPVTPGEAEALAEKVYPWRRHLHDPDSYWVTTSQAAAILHLSAQQVTRLLDQQRVPYVLHASGVRLMRRAQVSAMAPRFRSCTGSMPPQPGAPRTADPLVKNYEKVGDETSRTR
jgi:hypothetical protein